MNKRYRILPYKQGSKSAKALATALGGKVLKLEGSHFTPRAGDTIINWGNGDPGRAHVYPAKFIQLPNQQRNASNKLFFFNLMKEACPEVIPKFWTNQEEIPDEEFPIVCRTVLTGHSGAGIVIADTREALVEAPLYVKYTKKKDEYRVHIGRSASDFTTIAIQRKARRVGHENPNWQIRNHSNGFVFVRSDVNPHESVISSAKKALEATGLDFGAVDVIWNEHDGKALVLEINTAPGLEGQTIDDYAAFFKNA